MTSPSELSEADRKFLENLRCKPKGTRFYNWARTFTSRPEYFLAPESERDIIEIIQIAVRCGLSVKAIGSGHSPSDIACTDSIILVMDKLRRVIAYDSNACTMTVETGIRLRDLHQVLGQRNMALSDLCCISDQSIAGAISTATHGSGVGFGDLSSMITYLVLIDGTGKRVECDQQNNTDLFDAARCSLGALGIITQVTIKCEPAFKLHAVQKPITLDEVINDIDGFVRSAEHVRIWWFPYTEHAVAWRANRTSMEKKWPKESFVRDRLYGFHIYQLQLYKARFMPNDLPGMARKHFKRRCMQEKEWVDDSYRVFSYDCPLKQYVNEWAIPLDQAPSALKQLREWFNAEERKSDGVRVHFPVEVRFAQESNTWLSPTYRRTVCYFGITMFRPYQKSVPYKEYWQAFEDIMRTHQGRPHWAKYHGMFYHDLQRAYPRFDDFGRIRETCDPHGIFVNDYIRNRILPPSKP
ncbi:D-arabinono-1,4-lactone oxidase [Coemansia guatemalensis]|uniref:D-arabinono-1,4-lactone oxidase n=1 Tax=Coemansia guatemalensis TaxID=2761395 RepID=A0A9W8HQ57_9FUNG|nr:D-arabinono-1,4-lactone oxidase [Coemansia guatemalensis]